MLEGVLVDRARARAEVANHILTKWQIPFPLPADKEVAREQELRALVTFLDGFVDTVANSRALVWVHGEGFERIAGLAAAVADHRLRIDAVFESADDMERVAALLDEEDKPRVQLFVGHPTDFTAESAYQRIYLGWDDGGLDNVSAKWLLRATKRSYSGGLLEGQAHIATTLDREGQWAQMSRVLGEGLACLPRSSLHNTLGTHRSEYFALSRLVLRQGPTLPNLRPVVHEAHLCAFPRTTPFASLLLPVLHRGSVSPKKFDQLLEIAQAAFLLEIHRRSTHVLGDLVSYLEAL